MGVVLPGIILGFIALASLPAYFERVHGQTPGWGVAVIFATCLGAIFLGQWAVTAVGIVVPIVAGLVAVGLLFLGIFAGKKRKQPFWKRLVTYAAIFTLIGTPFHRKHQTPPPKVKIGNYLASLLLLLSMNLFSQEINFSVGFDPKMAITGPYKDSDPALDLTLQAGIGYDPFYVGAWYEVFHAINYQAIGSYTYFKIPWKAFDALVGFDSGVIFRKGQEVPMPTVGILAEVRYNIGRFAIGPGFKYQMRGDIGGIWKPNGVVRIWYWIQ